MLQSIFLLISLILLQGTFTITYTGYTYGVQGDVVVTFPNQNTPAIPKKLPVWISWTESMDSSWAKAFVYHEGRCDSMEFIRPPKIRRWILEKLNNEPRSRSINGHANLKNDSLHIAIGSFSGISYYAVRDSS
jgi:hypothetical protein